MNNGAVRILYLLNFYGCPCQKMIVRYLRENPALKVTVAVLPAVRLVKGALQINAFILDEKEETLPYNLRLPFPFPAFFTFVFQYVLNFFILFKLLRKTRIKKFDVCIALSNYNAALMYFLKLIGRCRFSVFMNGDILPDTNNYLHKGPSRLNRILNRVLTGCQAVLRRIAYKNDLIWFPIEKIRNWDLENGLRARQSFVANSPIDCRTVKHNLAKQKQPHTLCYIGGLYEYSGVDIAISSLRMVRDEIADVRVFFVGGSSLDVERYRELARRYGVERHIKFYGYVADEDKAQDILAGSMAGLALYKPVKDNMSLYTDSSKVKTYISAGLPVLITREGPEISRDIEGFGAGLLVDYDEADIAKNIIRILKDADLHSRLKQGVAKFGEAYDYKLLGGDIWGQISGRLKL